MILTQLEVICVQAMEMGKIVYRTKNQMVYTALREAIVSGRLQPGARLVIKELALSLGTSGIPVREAIKTLEAEGLVEVTPHVGPRVAGISIEGLKQALPVRAQLEAYATETAAPNVGAAELQQLEAVIDEMASAVSSNDPYAYGTLNRRFHLTIYAVCGNEFLRKMINDLWEKTERARSLFPMMPEILADSLEAHRKIVRLLRERRIEELREFAYQHKKRAFDRMIERLERLEGVSDSPPEGL
ncbi:MAG: GntR family transcriptional regulator [Firmicutes bacterium]|nr:GntR family transcriptional regulator [Bacillota bacterium]